MITTDTAQELSMLVGSELGISDWITLSEEDVLTFADVSRDRHWVHTDPERAARETEYGGVLAHGFHVLSLITDLSNQCYAIRGAERWLNYGLDRVRFTAPVRPGDELRLRLTLRGVAPREAATRLELDCVLELRDSPRPALAATWIVIVIESAR
jgi:acyl dehydratase